MSEFVPGPGRWHRPDNDEERPGSRGLRTSRFDRCEHAGSWNWLQPRVGVAIVDPNRTRICTVVEHQHIPALSASIRNAACFAITPRAGH
jgi:hypothetical protein